MGHDDIGTHSVYSGQNFDPGLAVCRAPSTPGLHR